MASSVKSNAPLIIAPNIAAPSDGSFSPQWNWSTESAWSGNNWLAETSTPALSSVRGFLGANSILFTGGATQTALNRITSITGYKGPATGQWYAGFWVFPTAYTGAPSVQIGVLLTTTGEVACSGRAEDTRAVLISTLNINKWNCVVIKLATVTAANITDWAHIDFRMSLVPAGGTTTFYTDGHWFGRALDLSDMTGAVTTGANFQHPYKISKRVLLDFDKSQAGKHYARRYNAGFHSGEEDTTAFGETDRDEWQSFMDYTMDGTAMTVFYDRTNPGYTSGTAYAPGTTYAQGDPVNQFGVNYISRAGSNLGNTPPNPTWWEPVLLKPDANYYPKTMLDQPDDGLEQIPGTPLWKAKFKWKENLA